VVEVLFPRRTGAGTDGGNEHTGKTIEVVVD
jgi:hypothetical protein